MSQLLIVFATTDGQTEKIAHVIANEIQEFYEKIELVAIEDVNHFNLDDFTHVIIGASIRYGKFKPAIYEFINDKFAILNSKKTAFYSVNLTARKFEKNTPTTNVYTRKFLDKVQWKPTKCAVFAGALLYPKYRIIDKMMIKLIMKMTKGETDTTKTVDYTDWMYVKTWAKEYAEITKLCKF